MTARKINMIRKNTYLSGQTFDDILSYVEKVINVNNYTAKQIAEIMEICKTQNEMGFDKAGKEFGIW